MLIDSFNRKIDYLRISVTDRCNLRCVYCMPECGIINKSHDQLLTFEEITRIVGVAASEGITKIRLTGGEPLVRKDVINLIASLSAIKQIEDISMTTNGVLLERYALELKKAGIKRLNISLDSLNDARYQSITRFGDLKSVKAGIEKAIVAGFSLIKINVLLLSGIGEDEIVDFIKLTKESLVHVRFLELMPVGNHKFYKNDCFITCEDVMEICRKFGIIEEASVYGNGPARDFRFKESVGTFGFIAPLTHKFCATCNRLRLTSDGFLKGCLHSDLKVNLKGPLRRGISNKELTYLIESAVNTKPQEHTLDKNTLKSSEYLMCQIGG